MHFGMSGSISFLPPYIQEEKSHLDVGGIEPRLASTIIWHSILIYITATRAVQ